MKGRTAKLTITGQGSITLTREEMAQLELPGRGIFGPMTSTERANALGICTGLIALIAPVKERGLEFGATERNLLDLIAALGVANGGPDYGPAVMRQRIETLMAAIAVVLDGGLPAEVK